MINDDGTRLLNLLWASSVPAILWWETGLKAAATMVAVPQVISHRTARMVRTASTPDRLDCREFAIMGTEKLAAFSQAWINAAREILTFQQQMANGAMRQWWVIANTLSSANPFTMFQNLTMVPIDLWSTYNRALSIAPRIAHGVVKPIHGTATRNAKRLARKKA